MHEIETFSSRKRTTDEGGVRDGLGNRENRDGMDT